MHSPAKFIIFAKGKVATCFPFFHLHLSTGMLKASWYQLKWHESACNLRHFTHWLGTDYKLKWLISDHIMKQNGRWKEAKEKTRQNRLSGILSFFIKKLNEKKEYPYRIFSIYYSSSYTYKYIHTELEINLKAFHVINKQEKRQVKRRENRVKS